MPNISKTRRRQPPLDAAVGLRLGDARNLQQRFSSLSGRFQSIITSPPYFDMQDYGVASQIGWGQTLKDYLADLRSVFAACTELTTENATMWLVLSTIRRHKRLLLLPEMIVEEAEQAGWIGREIVTWEKTKSLPWTKHGELRDVTEQLVLLSKADEFTFNTQSLLEPEPASEWWSRYPERYSPEGRMPTNLWRIPIPTQGSWRNGPSHACPFPYELTFRMIALATCEGDLVLDPFAGVGSVPAMATMMGRVGYGLELSPRYVSQFPATLAATTTWWSSYRDRLETVAQRRTVFKTTILELRLLKFARIIASHLISLGIPVEWVRVSRRQRHPDQPFKILSANFDIACEPVKGKRNVVALATAKANARPLSKFGVQPTFTLVSVHSPPPGGFWYESGKFWRQPRRSFPDDRPAPHVVAAFRPNIPAIESWNDPL